MIFVVMSTVSCKILFISFFFFNDTATTEIYTLSLHDALPISDADSGRGKMAGASGRARFIGQPGAGSGVARRLSPAGAGDRKSTRLNSSHSQISYAVFCLKKKNKIARRQYIRAMIH